MGVDDGVLAVLVWPLAAIGVATLALGALLAQPVRPPPPLESIHGGAMAIPQDGKPELSRFQARDGTWLAYRLYPAADGGRDQLAIVYHGSSASSEAMNATALALAKSGFVAIAVDARGHGASGSRGDIGYVGQLEDDLADLVAHLRADYRDSAIDAGRPFVGRRLRFARRRRAGWRELRSLRAARALSRLSRADQPPSGRAGSLGRARHSPHHRANDPRAAWRSIGRSRCRRSPSPIGPRRRWRPSRAIPSAC